MCLVLTRFNSISLVLGEPGRARNVQTSHRTGEEKGSKRTQKDVLPQIVVSEQFERSQSQSESGTQSQRRQSDPVWRRTDAYDAFGFRNLETSGNIENQQMAQVVERQVVDQNNN